MYYSQETEEMVKKIDREHLFSATVSEDVHQILRLRNKFSPLSDIRSILKREGLHLNRIIFSNNSSERFPLRNIVRLICKIANLEFAQYIQSIYFKEMRLGCDYFKGSLVIDTEEKERMIEFEWCWTDFNRGIGFDRFSYFEVKELKH